MVIFSEILTKVVRLSNKLLFTTNVTDKDLEELSKRLEQLKCMVDYSLTIRRSRNGV